MIVFLCCLCAATMYFTRPVTLKGSAAIVIVWALYVFSVLGLAALATFAWLRQGGLL